MQKGDTILTQLERDRRILKKIKKIIKGELATTNHSMGYYIAMEFILERIKMLENKNVKL